MSTDPIKNGRPSEGSARPPTNTFSPLTSDKKSWTGSSLLSVSQIDPSGLALLYRTASSMRNLVCTVGGDDRLKHRLLASVFYEASTRTSCSFQAAMMRLGGNFVHVDAGEYGDSSASRKGETLEHTIRCVENYVDVTVVRHPEEGSVGRAIQGATKPVINAGDGVGEHPTQALLDLFTICDELNLLPGEEDDVAAAIASEEEKEVKDPLVVVMVGDLKHGRTVHSLSKLLAQSNLLLGRTVILRYCSPKPLSMPRHVREYIDQYDDIIQENENNILEAIADANVLYVTRVQRERFVNDNDYQAVKGGYVIDRTIMHNAPSDMIVLHPLPRIGEITEEVDSDPRAAYFRQMENGMFVRMAILALVLGRV